MEIPQRHLRRRKKVDATEFMDDAEQENLILKFRTQAEAQAKLYRTVFAIVLVVPSPAFILARHCRVHPKLAFLCLVSLLTSVYSVKSQTRRTSLLRKLNIGLAGLLALQAWASRSSAKSRADLVWVFPLMAAVSAFVLDHWLEEVQQEIRRLDGARYELRGV